MTEVINSSSEIEVPWWVKARRRLRTFPVVGPALYRAWLHAVHGEGRPIEIAAGPAKGLRVRRAMGLTTVMPELSSGGYEPDCLERFRRELRPGQLVFDVGSHIGIFAMFAAREIGSSGRVIAVEAHPRNAAHIRSSLALNGIGNCEVKCVAVSDRVGQSFLIDPGNSSMFQLSEVSSQHDAGAPTRVETTTLEALADQYGDPDVIKMDIEGAEDLALHGAERLLRRKRPALLVEVHSAEIAASLHPYLRHVGYGVAELNGREIEGDRWERFIVATAR